MLKDAAISILMAVIVLALAIFVTVKLSGQESITLGGLDVVRIVEELEEEETYCPTGCISEEDLKAQQKKSRTNQEKEKLAQQPAQNVAKELEEIFVKAKPEVRIMTFRDDEMWWRSDEGYRLVATDAHTVGIEVTTLKDALKNTKESDIGGTHPATKNSQIKKAISTTTDFLKDIGFKKRSFNDCPVNFAGDPFNNCVNYFERDKMKCNLIVGLGSLENLSDQSKLRMELACTNSYDDFHKNVTPLIKAVDLLNPVWKTPDMATFRYLKSGNYYRVEFGDRVNDRYAIFLQEGKNYLLVSGGKDTISCEVVSEYKIPQYIYEKCNEQID